MGAGGKCHGKGQPIFCVGSIPAQILKDVSKQRGQNINRKPTNGARTLCTRSTKSFAAQPVSRIKDLRLKSTIAFANSFVQRSLFRSEYPDLIPNADFVNKIFSKANLAGAANDTLRQAEIDAMNMNGKTRAQVLLDVIEIQEFKDREYKPAFVLMQYFGYLRHDPDQEGYDFWLNILNNKLPNDASGFRYGLRVHHFSVISVPLWHITLADESGLLAMTSPLVSTTDLAFSQTVFRSVLSVV